MSDTPINEPEKEKNGLNVGQWLEMKATEAETVADVLPSGLKVERYKHVDLESLILSGPIPLGLLQDQGLVTESPGQVEIDTADVLANLKEFTPMIDSVFIAAMANPRIGDTTAPDEDPPILALALFSIEDRLYIMNKATAAAKAAAPVFFGRVTATA